jgi:hypothetical protein
MVARENCNASAPSYAKFIGRIGALAAALGVGVAIVTGQGIGVAHANETVAEVGDSSDVGSPPDTGSSPEESTDPLPTQRTSPNGSDNSTPASNSGPGSVPRMNFSTSGGALVSDRWQRRSALRRAAHASPNDTNQTVPPSSPTSINDGSGVQQFGLGPESTKNQRHSELSQGPIRLLAPSLTAPVRKMRTPTTVKLDGPEPGRLDGLHTPDVTAGRQQFTAKFDDPDAMATARRPAAATLTVVQPTVTRPATILNRATDVLSAAFSSFLTPRPATPAQPPVLLAVLGWVRREIEHTLFNRVPDVHNQVIDVQTGTSRAGDVAVDPDDNTLTYSVPERGQKGGPTMGTVTINPSTGEYTYTPDTTAMAGQSDEFTVVASDAADGFHLHGLFGFLRPGGGHTDTAVVTVNIVNGAPVAPSLTYNVIVGDANELRLKNFATDPDDDPLRFPTIGVDTPDHPIKITIDKGTVIESEITVTNPYITLFVPLGVHTDMNTFTFTALQPGTFTMTYTVTDERSTVTGTITVNASAVVVGGSDEDALDGPSPL